MRGGLLFVLIIIETSPYYPKRKKKNFLSKPSVGRDLLLKAWRRSGTCELSVVLCMGDC